MIFTPRVDQSGWTMFIQRWEKSWPRTPHIHVHHGKTQVWNRGGIEPSGVEEMARAARVVKPDAVVWRGDPLLPTSQQGVKVLGIPIGHTKHVREFLERKTRQQEVLFQRIPSVNDTQAVLLLLTMCGTTWANFWLRAVRPEDATTLTSLAAGAIRVRAAAHWASWADSLRMIKQRHPLTARLMARQLEAHEPVGCFLSVLQCQRQLTDAGLVIPPWEELANTPPERVEEPEPSQPKMGWQQRASRKLEDRFINDTVWPALTDSARALVRSQHGPLSLFCRRPRRQDWTLNLSAFSCAGDFTCPFPCPCAPADVAANMISLATIVLRVLWVLGKRGCPLECAAAQVCREGGARVSANVPVRDLDLVAHNNLDGRRQLTIDTTLVSPLRRDGSARARAADHDGAVLVEARRRKERTYPELSGEGVRARGSGRPVEWRNCTVLGCFGRRQSPVLPIHLAKQGESRLRSQVERSSRLFCGPCVYYVLAGPTTRGRLEWGRSVSA